ncbi:hypothetical protein PLESTB_000624600, partial [Pleodorina starrii]
GWGPTSTPIGGTFSPPEAEPAMMAAPPGARQGSPSGALHREQQSPSRAPTSPQAGSAGRWWRQPDAFTRHHQPLDPTSARGGPTLTQPPPQAPPTGTAGHHGPGGDGGPELPPQLAPNPGWAARGPPPQLAAHSPTAQAASPPHQPPPGPSTAPGLGLPTAELDVLRAASLITATPSQWAPPADNLAAGYHDQFVDYFAACPHPACSSIAFQAVLRKLFIRHHPRLESPELVDPRPVVVAFCRRALHQLDLSPPAPLGAMELDALLLRENHSYVSPRCPPVLPEVMAAAQSALEPALKAQTGNHSSAGAFLKVYHDHLSSLAPLLPGLHPTSGHVPGCCGRCWARCCSPPPTQPSPRDPWRPGPQLPTPCRSAGAKGSSLSSTKAKACPGPA